MHVYWHDRDHGNLVGSGYSNFDSLGAFEQFEVVVDYAQMQYAVTAAQVGDYMTAVAGSLPNYSHPNPSLVYLGRGEWAGLAHNLFDFYVEDNMLQQAILYWGSKAPPAAPRALPPMNNPMTVNGAVPVPAGGSMKIQVSGGGTYTISTPKDDPELPLEQNGDTERKRPTTIVDDVDSIARRLRELEREKQERIRRSQSEDDGTLPTF